MIFFLVGHQMLALSLTGFILGYEALIAQMTILEL